MTPSGPNLDEMAANLAVLRAIMACIKSREARWVRRALWADGVAIESDDIGRCRYLKAMPIRMCAPVLRCGLMGAL